MTDTPQESSTAQPRQPDGFTAIHHAHNASIISTAGAPSDADINLQGLRAAQKLSQEALRRAFTAERVPDSSSNRAEFRQTLQRPAEDRRPTTPNAHKLSLDHIMNAEDPVTEDPVTTLLTTAAAALARLANEPASGASSPIKTTEKATVLPGAQEMQRGSNTPEPGLETPNDTPMPDALEGMSTLSEGSSQTPTPQAPVPAAASGSKPAKEYTCCYQLPEECGVQKQGEQLTLKDCRPCVSDHFGRNKACTKLIPRLIRFCRKHYQRSAYHKKRWPFQKCDLILSQLDWIEEDVPNVTFEIAIKKSEMLRLSADSIAKAAESEANSKTKPDTKGKGKAKATENSNDDEASDSTPAEKTKSSTKGKGKAKAMEDDNDSASDYAAPKKTSHKLFEAPIPILRHIESTFCGHNKTASDCADVVEWCRDQLEQGTLTDLPVVEFLPENLPPLPKTATTTTTPGASTGPKRVKLRVSPKGAVKKP